jgi:DNA primase
LRALERALPLLLPGRSLRFATLPPGEDPDSLIRGGGAGGFGEILAAARPLSEVLWQAELRARPIDTPERRADLDHRLMRRADLIADRAVQNEYRRFLRDRLFQLGRARVGASPGSRSALPPRSRLSGPFRSGAADLLPDFAPPRPQGRINREVFLGVFVNHPSLIEEWIEEIAAVEFPEPELDSLRRAILEIPDSHPGLDATALQQHLALCGHAEILGVLAITIARHAGFAARGGDDPEVIRLGLTETLQLMRSRSRNEVGAATAAFATEPTVENSQRLTALKERELREGPIGGTDR